MPSRLLILLSTLVFCLCCASRPALAVEDFRSAIKSIVPHLVLVRKADVAVADGATDKSDGAEESTNPPEKKGTTDQSKSATEQLIEALRSKSEDENYQHAFRVADDLIATVDNEPAVESALWQLLSRDGEWNDLSVVGRDRISNLIVLKSNKDLLDEIASEGSMAGGAPVGQWTDGFAEMGLPTVVVWYERGAPRAKATMVAATGNYMTRGLAILDFAFPTSQVGAPVLDAEGKFLGLLADHRDFENTWERERRLELRNTSEKEAVASPENRSNSPLASDSSKTVIITTQSLEQDTHTADYLVPVKILNRLLSDVKVSSGPVILERGLAGIVFGNGDASLKDVVPGSAADEAGMKPGDRIVGIDGQAVQNDLDIMIAFLTLRAGDVIDFQVDSTSTNDDPADSSETDNGEGPKSKSVQVTMRGIRTVPRPPRARNSESPSPAGSSSSLNQGSVEISLVGSKSTTTVSNSKPGDSESKERDLNELRLEIELLLREIAKYEEESQE